MWGGMERGKRRIRGRKKDALTLTGLSPRYLVSRGADVLTKEIVGKFPICLQKAGELISEAGLTSTVGRKIQNWKNLP